MVEEIIAARTYRHQRQVLIKWVGWAETTWEPLSVLEDTEALDRFEAQYGDAHLNDGPQTAHSKKRKGIMSQARP